MIHQSFIDSARNIRVQYEKTQKEILSYQKDVQQLAEDFGESAHKVEMMGEDIQKNKLSLKEIENGFVNILNSLEDNYKILFDKINKINADIEFLKKQEWDLYEIIKKRYPSLSDEDIKNEIQASIEKPLK